MRTRSDRPQLILLLLGATALTALSISKLPAPFEIFKAPSTPFDRTAAGAAPEYRLFSKAVLRIPIGSSVAPISQPRNAVRETSLAREAIGLFPGRKVLQTAVWDTPTHLEGQADFLVVVGPRPSPPPGELVFETPDGSLWRRHGP